MALVLVHLSDIHFQKRRIDGGYDVDQDVRNELELDLGVMRGEVGVPAGVVLTGDIAFAADAKEYEAAVTWLARISVFSKATGVSDSSHAPGVLSVQAYLESVLTRVAKINKA
jgi:hypothetical protein